MLDLKQLDDIFSNEHLSKSVSAGDKVLSRQKKRARLVKITFPAIAAALVGLLAVWPALQDRGDFSIKISKPTKGEIEKLHVKNSVLYVTDKANRVNSFTAENIDETEPGSQLVKMQNPKGKLPTSDVQWVDVTAPTGFYNQKDKLFYLVDGVELLYSDNMKASTKEMYYETDKSLIYGNTPVIADGKYGHLDAKAFEYSTKNEVLKFKGNTTIKASEEAFGNKIDIYATKTVEFHRRQQKLVATGNALMKRPNLNVSGDVLSAIFSKGTNGKNTIKDFSGDGILVSTPVGSTAYNYSLDGALVSPDLDVLQLTPVAPMNTNAYRCFHSSILLPASECIRITGIGRSTRGTIILSFDGRTHEFSNVNYVEITQSDKEVHLIRNHDYDYWKKLSSKLL